MKYKNINNSGSWPRGIGKWFNSSITLPIRHHEYLHMPRILWFHIPSHVIYSCHKSYIMNHNTESLAGSTANLIKLVARKRVWPLLCLQDLRDPDGISLFGGGEIWRILWVAAGSEVITAEDRRWYPWCALQRAQPRQNHNKPIHSIIHGTY